MDIEDYEQLLEKRDREMEDYEQRLKEKDAEIRTLKELLPLIYDHLNTVKSSVERLDHIISDF